MAWDQDLEVLSPVGRPMSEQMAEGPRRQALDGFDPVYRDIVDYIVRCTHRIWEEKNAGLCRTHYGAECVMHTLAGPTTGIETVTQNTVAAVTSYADRVVLAEDVIWSEDAPGVFYSSHRISSRSTHFGDEPLVGAATMRGTGATTIADCKVVANRIVEEWLVRDNSRALWQVGAEPSEVAAAVAALDREGDQTRHDWRKAAIAETRSMGNVDIDPGHPAFACARMLCRAFVEDLYGEAAQQLSPAAEVRWPSNRHGFGRGYWIGCLTQIAAVLHDRAWRCEHVAARPLPRGDIAVALRWSLTGWHRGTGVWGEPSGRELYLLAASHYRLRDGCIVEDVTVFDEVAVLRQIAGGLGA
ncbi:ester cyclase [Novosphingobium sp. Gsoil 351]|uniref:ester cyclase n=1 Tax=Novosphingobium sp. Gsoil 351 TaxID=2675225 RepID=UPI0018A85C16|nr:ester cyclase [Novosphingobium sp. Gsoil 351]